jgi:hypothetical protein
LIIKPCENVFTNFNFLTYSDLTNVVGFILFFIRMTLKIYIQEIK